MDNDRRDDSSSFDLSGYYITSMPAEKQGRLNKKFVSSVAISHLEEFVKILLTDRDCIDWKTLTEQLVIALNKLENRKVCYSKVLPNGQLIIYKGSNCRFSEEYSTYYRKPICSSDPCPYQDTQEINTSRK